MYSDILSSIINTGVQVSLGYAAFGFGGTMPRRSVTGAHTVPVLVFEEPRVVFRSGRTSSHSRQQHTKASPSLHACQRSSLSLSGFPPPLFSFLDLFIYLRPGLILTALRAGPPASVSLVLGLQKVTMMAIIPCPSESHSD